MRLFKLISLPTFLMLILLSFMSCGNNSVNEENDKQEADTTTIKQDANSTDLIATYDGVFFRMQYRKQLSDALSFDFKDMTSQQQDEFLSILENGSKEDAKKFIENNKLNIGERIEVVDSINGIAAQISVMYTLTAESFDLEKEGHKLSKKAENEGANIVGVGSTLANNYYVESSKDNVHTIRFIVTGDNNKCVLGEIFYPDDSDPILVITLSKMFGDMMESVEFK